MTQNDSMTDCNKYVFENSETFWLHPALSFQDQRHVGTIQSGYTGDLLTVFYQTYGTVSRATYSPHGMCQFVYSWKLPI